MLKKYKVIQEFSELHLGNVHLRRQHLTDAEVAAFRALNESSFHNYFEEIPTTEGNPDKKGKSKKGQDDSEPTT